MSVRKVPLRSSGYRYDSAGNASVSNGESSPRFKELVGVLWPEAGGVLGGVRRSQDAASRKVEVEEGLEGAEVADEVASSGGGVLGQRGAVRVKNSILLAGLYAGFCTRSGFAMLLRTSSSSRGLIEAELSSNFCVIVCGESGEGENGKRYTVILHSESRADIVGIKCCHREVFAPW